MNTRRAGFTLIELLVVIAIISVLLALLLPSLGGIRNTARTTRCAANLRSIGAGLTMYERDNRERFPTWSGWHVFGADGTPPDAPGPGWTEEMLSDVGTPEVFRDPSRPAAEAPFAYFLQSRYTYSLFHKGSTSLPAARPIFPAAFILAGDTNNRIFFHERYGDAAVPTDCDQDDATQPCVFLDPSDPLRLDPHKGGAANLLFLDAHCAAHRRYEPSIMTWHGTKMTDWLGAL